MGGAEEKGGERTDMEAKERSCQPLHVSLRFGGFIQIIKTCNDDGVADNS